jgi:hypothetical protein
VIVVKETRRKRVRIPKLIDDLYFFSDICSFFPSSGSSGRRKLSTLVVYTEEDSSIDMTGLTSDVGDASDNSKINVSFR